MPNAPKEKDGPVRRLFEALLNPDGTKRETDGLYALFVGAAAITLVVFFACIILGRGGKSGEWGDFFGGFLNPLLTFITFMGVLITIVLQQRELRDSREELRKSADALINQNDVSGRQIFETSFFQMLNLHNNIVGTIDRHLGNGRVKSGRDCFTTFLSHFQTTYRKYESSHPNTTDAEKISLAYKDYWQNKNSELGHYYRYLYNMVRFVDSNKYAEPYHMKLIRAQLSDQELSLLFYNSTTDMGARFVKYAKKHDLFDNLTTEMLISPSHASLIPRPKKPTRKRGKGSTK